MKKTNPRKSYPNCSKAMIKKNLKSSLGEGVATICTKERNI